MRARRAAVVGMLAVAGLGACGGRDVPSLCHTYTSACAASCLDGSSPQFTATSTCTFTAKEYFDPLAEFCSPGAVPSHAANTCPSQATSGGPYDCTACSAPIIQECACPEHYGPF